MHGQRWPEQGPILTSHPAPGQDQIPQTSRAAAYAAHDHAYQQQEAEDEGAARIPDQGHDRGHQALLRDVPL